MAQFMLLLRDGPTDFSQFSPADMQAVIQKYESWGKKLASEGKLLDGRKLSDGEGRMLDGLGGRTKLTDGPFGETKEVIGGFYLIAAKDYDEAVAIARGCPQLEFQGSVEVRRVDLMED